MSLAFTLVLPLGIVIFSHYLISDRLQEKIFRNENLVSHEEGTPAAADTEKVLNKEVVGLGILTLLYVIFVLALSLLSTAAIVYSVASIYTGKGLSYFKVISVVPKVWKRLVITFLWAQLVILCYHISFAILFFLFLLLQKTIGVTMLPILIPLAVAFYIILVYLSLLWHLASVISVLEDSTGLQEESHRLLSLLDIHSLYSHNFKLLSDWCREPNPSFGQCGRKGHSRVFSLSIVDRGDPGRNPGTNCALLCVQSISQRKHRPVYALRPFGWLFGSVHASQRPYFFGGIGC
jgi:hypothetical protein